MSDYILNRDDNGMVRYLYRNGGKFPCVGKTKWESARWMLEKTGKQGIRMTEEYEGFPLTADGEYFFDGRLSEGDGEATSFVTADAVPFSHEGEGSEDCAGEAEAPVCGPDYCEIPELAEDSADGAKAANDGAEKPKRRKRVKDAVCE